MSPQISRFTVADDEHLAETLAYALARNSTALLQLTPVLGGDSHTVAVKPTGFFLSGDDSQEVIVVVAESDRYTIGTTANVTLEKIGDIVMGTVNLLEEKEV